MVSFNLRPFYSREWRPRCPLSRVVPRFWNLWSMEKRNNFFLCRKFHADSPGKSCYVSVTATGLGSENRIQDLQSTRSEHCVFNRDVWRLLLKRSKRSVGYLRHLYQLLILLREACYDMMIWCDELEWI
jgi:hypothetical protein